MLVFAKDKIGSCETAMGDYEYMNINTLNKIHKQYITYKLGAGKYKSDVEHSLLKT